MGCDEPRLPLEVRTRRFVVRGRWTGSTGYGLDPRATSPGGLRRPRTRSRDRLDLARFGVSKHDGIVRGLRQGRENGREPARLDVEEMLRAELPDDLPFLFARWIEGPVLGAGAAGDHPMLALCPGHLVGKTLKPFLTEHLNERFPEQRAVRKARQPPLDPERKDRRTQRGLCRFPMDRRSPCDGVVPLAGIDQGERRAQLVDQGRQPAPSPQVLAFGSRNRRDCPRHPA